MSGTVSSSRKLRRRKGITGQTTKVLQRGDDRIKVVLGVRDVDQSEILDVGTRRTSKALPMAVSLCASIGNLTEGDSKDHVMLHTTASPCNNCQGLVRPSLCNTLAKCPPKIYP